MTSDPSRMLDLAWGLICLTFVIVGIAWTIVRARQRTRVVSAPFIDAEVIEAKLLPSNGADTFNGCVGCGVKRSPLWHFEETIVSSYGPFNWRKRLRAAPADYRMAIKIDDMDTKRKRGLEAMDDTFRGVCPACHVQRNYAIDQQIEGNYLKRLELERQLASNNQQFLEGLNESLRKEQARIRKERLDAARKG